MKNKIIAMRYAKAMMGCVGEENLDTVHGQLRGLRELVNKPSIHRFFASPIVKLDDKKQVMEETIAQLQASPRLRGALLTIVEAGRAGVLTDIIDYFGFLLQQARNEVPAKVISATPMDEKQLERLTHLLSEKFQKKVLLETEISSEVLGGFVVKMDNTIIDMSLKGWLIAATSKIL